MSLTLGTVDLPRQYAFADSDATTVSEVANSAPRFLIPQIQELPDGGVIPPEIFRLYDSRTISENIVYRLHRHFEAGMPIPNNSVPVNLMEQTTLTLRVDVAVFSSIVQRGFLNQHQSGSSGGSFHPEGRAKADENLAGVAFEPTYVPAADSPIHKVRPKFSWITVASDAILAGNLADTAEQYGALVAVLKEDVKKRTTMTVGDSLGPASDNDLRGARRRSHQSTMYGSSLPVQEKERYLEAQIFGELDVRDVAYFAIPAELEQAPIVELVKSSGIPLRLYTVEYEFSRHNFRPGKVLYAGDAAKMASLESSRAASIIVGGRPIGPENGCGQLIERLKHAS